MADGFQSIDMFLNYKNTALMQQALLWGSPDIAIQQNKFQAPQAQSDCLLRKCTALPLAPLTEPQSHHYLFCISEVSFSFPSTFLFIAIFFANVQ